MDTAINGQGFFRVVDQNGSVMYSRNGQFQLNSSGFIVNAQGDEVTGYLPNAAGQIIASSPPPLQISAANLAPQQTANVAVGVNLALITAPSNPVFNPNDPTSYNNSTSTTVYDSLGVSHVATMYFQDQPVVIAGTGTIDTTGLMTLAGGTTAGLSVGNTVTLGGTTYTISSINSGTTLTVTPAPAAVVPAGAVTTNAPSPNWNTYVTVDGVPVPNPAAPLTTLVFNTSGQLVAPAAAAPLGLGQVVSAAFTPSGASAAQTLTFNFGQTSQYGGSFGVNSLTQDGYATGQLTGFTTSANGMIMGNYTNGQTRTLGQMVLANFTNPQGLQPNGNNTWVQTAASGSPLVGTPGSGSLGVLQSSATEDSNVDLTAELVNMMTAQRNYQANAQTIKTEDQIMATLVNLR